MGQRPSFSHLTGYPEAVASAQDFAPYGHTEICLALHRARPFTHLAATDGGRDMPNKWVGDRFVPRPVVSYGVYEGPARFGRPVEGSGQLEGGDDELRLAFGYNRQIISGT